MRRFRRRCCTIENSDMMGTNLSFRKVYKCRTCGFSWTSEVYIRTEYYGEKMIKREVIV